MKGLILTIGLLLLAVLMVSARPGKINVVDAHQLLDQCTDDIVPMCLTVSRTSCTTVAVEVSVGGEPVYERTEVDIGRSTADGNLDVACKRVGEIANCQACLMLRDVRFTPTSLHGCVWMEERCNGEMISENPLGCFDDGGCDNGPGLGRYEQEMYFTQYSSAFTNGAVSYYSMNDPVFTTKTIVSGFDRADSIAVDELKGFVYWVQRQANDDDAATLMRSRFNGVNVTSMTTNLRGLRSVAVTGAGAMMFYSLDGDANAGSLLVRVPLTPFPVPFYITPPVQMGKIHDMKFDLKGRFLVMVGDVFGSNSGYIVKLDVTTWEFSFVRVPSAIPRSIAVDYDQDALFIATDHSISRVNFNLTTIDRIHNETHEIHSIEVDKRFEVRWMHYTGGNSSTYWTSTAPNTIVGGMIALDDNPYCCSAHSGPSCLDANVAWCVCQRLPDCCSLTWSQQCVDAVETFACGNCHTGPCCLSHELRGCTDRNVTECVCNARHECCTDRWNSTCVDAVEAEGCGVCHSDCCFAHEAPSCVDQTVSSCVCSFDPFCCEVSWDDQCVQSVAKHSCGSCF